MDSDSRKEHTRKVKGFANGVKKQRLLFSREQALTLNTMCRRIIAAGYPTSNPQLCIRKCTALCWGACKLADSIRDLVQPLQGARQTLPSARGYRMRLIQPPHQYRPRMSGPSHCKYWLVERHSYQQYWPTSAAGCFRHTQRQRPGRVSPGQKP